MHTPPPNYNMVKQHSHFINREQKVIISRKNIAIRYHYVKDANEDGMVARKYFRSEEQLADLLTKSVDRFTMIFFAHLSSS